MNDKTSSVQKITFFVFCILFFIFTLSIVWPSSALAATDVRDSMVKIYCVQNEPDYDNPWNMSGPEAFSGSGCVIEGNRILTNAHVVSDHTFIMVRLHGQSQKHPAKVIAVSHEADLALLSVEERSFFKGVKPLKLGELPEIEQEVIVCGFPEGGDMLSTTKGVISRVEMQRYVHSMIGLLAGQLDAAINAGNSGGPVLMGDRIVGVVMQARKKSQNIGYMVPAPVIDHFLVDVADGRYDGFPEDGIIFQQLENKSLKQMYGLEENQSGALVSAITTGSPAEGKIFTGDVLLAIDGHRIADDGTVEFRPGERTGSDFYVKQRQVGEDLVYEILRQGQMKTVRLKLDINTRSGRLVPMKRYDVQPTYYVYGGLVFCPLTLNYLLSWGDDWAEDAPYSLLNYFVDGELTREGEEVVVIIKVLASNLNNGYDDLVDSRIVEVNGKPILNLQDLIRTVETDTETEFVVFKTEYNQSIALDRKKAEAAQAEILTTYRIAEDRSVDLKAAADSNATDGKKAGWIQHGGNDWLAITKEIEDDAMFLDLHQKQILTQRLVMTPQLQQAIKLLQLSRVELAETIRQELAENPALEEAAEPKAEDGIDDLSGLHEYLNPYDRSRATSQTEVREFANFETYTAGRETLTEHLLQQLLMTSPTAGEEKIGCLIAGSLNKDGYLAVSINEISEMSDCEPEKVERVLALMQTFDPPGVCARDLRECLLLQINGLNTLDSAAGEIIAGHLEDLAKRDYSKISKTLKVDLEDVAAAAKVIASLEPRPGRQFADTQTQYIEPDIFVFKIKNEFVISLNNSGLPFLRISSFFKKSLKNGKKITNEANDYLKDKLRSAQWLIKSIHERQRTIFRVMESILKYQRDFFEHGVSHLKPMVLRDVAGDIDMAESTVSRVTANKYVHTPHGIFELKYFFTSHVKSSYGEPVSSTVVQEKIRQIVAAENPQKPLSDDKITRILQTSGINIARRTVAKYRENIGILASSRRKRLELELKKGSHAKPPRR